jgi:GNAT superfamily N-acetyltransferase
VSSLHITAEPIRSAGATSLYYAAVDELNWRYGDHDDHAPIFDDFNPPSGFFLVARVGEHLAGGVGVRDFSPAGEAVGEIKRLWVRPDLRRTGVARALMADAEERARLAGYRELYLETGNRQPEAISLYEALGWRHVDRYPHDERQYREGIIFHKRL